MNCKQAENLLPLFVSRDLDERREALIAAHAQNCANCASAIAEYREARQLLRDSAPPAFDESVFDEMRRSVWVKIEAQSSAPSFAEMLASWFRPRVVGVAATAMLLVALVTGVYLITRPKGVRHEVGAVIAGSGIPVKEKQGDETFPKDLPPGKGQRPGIRQPEHLVGRTGARDRLNTPVANAPDVAVVMPGSSPIKGLPEESLANGSGDNPKPLRVEIQTKDPNIRIIWFAQRDTKPVSSNSKGT